MKLFKKHCKCKENNSQCWICKEGNYGQRCLDTELLVDLAIEEKHYEFPPVEKTDWTARKPII
jgi:hypothetical protein